MFIKGFILGVALSAPIGVIGIWCIQRSMYYGMRFGLATGFGAVMADLIFAILAVLGFSQFIQPYIQDNPWPGLIGAALIMYMGVKTLLKANPNNQIKVNENPSLVKSFLSSFVLILTHPAAIFVFLGIFTGLGFEFDGNTDLKIIAQLLIGLFLGGMSWWLFLAGLSAYLGKKMTPNLMQKFNWASGFLVTGFGLWLAYSALS